MTSSTEESSADVVPPASWPWSPASSLSMRGVELRPSREQDSEELFFVLDHDVVWTHVKGRPASANEWATIISTAQGLGRWMWTVRRDDVVVGSTSFLDLSVADARVEIGHTTYAPSVWGSEVNAACKLLLMTWAFETASMNRVQLKTDLRNVRSQRAIEKLGAMREGVLRMYQRRQDNTIRDTVLFSVLAQEWPTVKQGLAERLMP